MQKETCTVEEEEEEEEEESLSAKNL